MLSKFKDFEIARLSEDDIYSLLYDYMINAIPKFYCCRKDLDDRSEDSFEFNYKLSPVEIDILSNYAVIDYIDSNYIKTPTLMKASLSSSDFNTFSPANHLGKLNDMREIYRKRNEGQVSRYAIIRKGD